MMRGCAMSVQLYPVRLYTPAADQGSMVVEVVGVGSPAVLPSNDAGIPTLDESVRLLPGRHSALGRSSTPHPGRTVASQVVG